VEHWDGDQLDGWLVDYEAARREAAPGADFGFMSYYRGAYRLELTELAATEAAAREQAEKRLAVPERWALTLEVRPAPRNLREDTVRRAATARSDCPQDP
jgi:hypothetical protein